MDASLSEREVEHFLRIVEGSISVRNRHHFFLWVRGALQALFPHTLLLCAVAQQDRSTWEVAPVAETPYSKSRLRELCGMQGGLLGRVMEECRAGDGRPILACPGFDGYGYLRFRADLERYGLDNLAAHGLLAAHGDMASCFGFIGMPRPLTLRHAYLLQILVPHLLAALVRALIHERRSGPGDRVRSPPLTRREIEVLSAVREGLSNAAVARSLGVSPLTVKNHVQRILKKLQARNRTQAVACGITQRIISPEA